MQRVFTYELKLEKLNFHIYTLKLKKLNLSEKLNTLHPI